MVLMVLMVLIRNMVFLLLVGSRFLVISPRLVMLLVISNMVLRNMVLLHNMVLIGNRLAPDDALWESLTGLMSETAMVSRPELIDYLLDVCEVCDLGVSGFIKNLGRWLMDRSVVPVEALARRVKRVSVKTFMDAWTMNVERLQQCCVHVGSTDDGDPVRIPFCARQTFGALRKRTSAGMVGARELSLVSREVIQ